jgi:hypothetical protein
MGCIARIMLLALLLLVLLLVGGCFLATRAVGPAFRNGAFVYEVNGQRREVRLSTEAARRYDAKVNGRLSGTDVRDALTGGVVVTEEELNSRIAEELAGRGIMAGDARVERVFVRLTDDGARAYVYTTTGPLDVTFTSDLAFEVCGGRVTVRFGNVHAGRLPVQPLVTGALHLLDERDRLEDAISFVIPREVRSIRVEEGRLRAVLLSLPGGR